MGAGDHARTGATALLPLCSALVWFSFNKHSFLPTSVPSTEVLLCSSLQPLTSQDVLGSDWSEDVDEWLEVGGWGSGPWFHPSDWSLIVVRLNISVGKTARSHGGALKLKAAAAIKRRDDWIFLL